jgi:hypothetical protein
MPSHDLNVSLEGKSQAAPRRRLAIAPAVAAMGLLLAVFVAIWVAVVDDPDGGRAVAVATISDAAPVTTGSLPKASTGNPLPDSADAALTEVAAHPGMPLTDVAAASLIEQSAFGPLPRVAPDGRRPREAYARRVPPPPENTPRIVLVVSGLGLSQTGTQNAIEALPEDVTLAFAPYGGSLQRWVDKARGEGHEVLLQIPLEPAGYPDRNPGEHTLLVSKDRLGREEDLKWVLSRTTGYAGVMNHMGGRFLTDEKAVLPLLGDVGRRGLFFVEDGSIAQSRVASAATSLDVPVLVGDLILDRQRSAEEIGRQLLALEQIAATKGVAVGVASAFPESVAVLAEWARSAPEKGIALVPATAALLR